MFQVPLGLILARCCSSVHNVGAALDSAVPRDQPRGNLAGSRVRPAFSSGLKLARVRFSVSFESSESSMTTMLTRMLKLLFEAWSLENFPGLQMTDIRHSRVRTVRSKSWTSVVAEWLLSLVCASFHISRVHETMQVLLHRRRICTFSRCFT
jgi:hypothetical protein